ncbi:hypothetical protein KY284_008227 [Solanum tuberosum]|nr:hypothetical protein KY284_008227 [Solanum tuberosum]
MAPKAKNIASGAGSKRNWKGEAFRSSCSREPLQKFEKKVVERYGHEWFECQKEAKYLGDEFINEVTEGIEEELDMSVARHPNLIGKIVDMTRTKALDMSHGPVLSAQEQQARDDSVMARMFGMAELQLRIGDRTVTDEEMETLVDRYPLTDSATYLCRTRPAFQKPLDDDEVTADEGMDDDEEKDDGVNEDATALMVFDDDRDDDEA